MLKNIIKKVSVRYNIGKPKVVVGVPSGITEVEERAVEEAIMQAGAKEVYLMEEPMAAAIGANLNVEEPSGNIIVDIGGGTTEVAVISLGGIVVSNSLRVAGDELDEDIVNYVKREYNLAIGETTAEQIKKQIGCAIPLMTVEEMEVKGRDLNTGLPKNIIMNSTQAEEAIKYSIYEIIEIVKNTLEKTPPELASDIAEKGIILAGGGALIKNLDKLLSEKTGMPVYVADNPLDSVVRGTGKTLQDLEKLKNIANNEWNGNKYLFVDYCDLGNDTFHDLMPRLYFMQEKFPTKIMDKSKDKMKRDLADRLILDIYPMDNASDNIIKHKFNMLRIKILYNLLMGHRGYIDYEEYKKLSKWKVDLIKLVNNIGKRVPYSKLIKWMNKLIQIENKHDTQNYYMSSGPIYYVERTYSKKFFKEGKLMDFENMKVFVPSNPEGLLHAQNYGDFMKYPPYAMRKPSHYFNSDISIW